MDNLSFVRFDKVDTEILVPLSISTDLSTDQAQLFAYCHLLEVGNLVPQPLANHGNQSTGRVYLN